LPQSFSHFPFLNFLMESSMSVKARGVDTLLLREYRTFLPNQRA